MLSKCCWRPVQPLIMLEGYFYSASSFLKSYDQVLLCEVELDTFGWFFFVLCEEFSKKGFLFHASHHDFSYWNCRCFLTLSELKTFPPCWPAVLVNSPFLGSFFTRQFLKQLILVFCLPKTVAETLVANLLTDPSLRKTLSVLVHNFNYKWTTAMIARL